MTTHNPIPEEKRVDHLILLVGGNPLPNAVAGKLLAKPGATITLLHSGDTAFTAQRLSTWLGRQTQAVVQFKQVDEASPTNIEQGIQEQLRTVRAQTVGLHYTGGTKAMAVHAYLALVKWEKLTSPPIYTYLDARTLSLIADGEANPIPLADALQLTLDDLLALHGRKVKNPPSTEPILPEFAQALLKLYVENNLTAWNGWKGQELIKCRRENRTDKWRSKSALNTITLDWPYAPELAEVVAALQKELEQGDVLQIETATAAGIKKGWFKEPEDLCKQLYGGYWLESCVLEALLSIADDYRLPD